MKSHFSGGESAYAVAGGQVVPTEYSWIHFNPQLGSGISFLVGGWILYQYGITTGERCRAEVGILIAPPPAQCVDTGQWMGGQPACTKQRFRFPPFLESFDGKLVSSSAGDPFVLVGNVKAHRGNDSVTRRERS